MYTLDIAKAEYKEGYLEYFTIQRLAGGWSIFVSEGSRNKAISKARGGIRYFKTLDAAVKCVEEIGFDVDYLSSK
jgi:hypothetical protein